jgi:prophage regulatory protein
VLKMKLLRLKQVKELTTLSQATIYRLAAKGAFPKQVIIGDRAAVWLEDEVIDFLNQKIANR